MRRKKSDNGAMIMLVFFVGGPIFLLMEHPILFWLIFAPVVTLITVKFINWLLGKNNGR